MSLTRSIACLLAVFLGGCSAFLEDDVPPKPELQGQSIHSLSYETIDGETRSFDAFDGQVVLIVNTASECGYTPQYAGLERLQERYGEEGLVVLGFPCNDFGGQEPGLPAEIQAFCSSEFAISFPLGAKVQVKEGEGQSPVYAFLGGALGKLPGWNFGKYVVARDGEPIAFYASNVEPDSDELIQAIETELAR
jgi:glutathione peroxidase